MTVEPGTAIATGNCPICGSDITVEHGDEPGEVVFLAHSNQKGRDLRALYQSRMQALLCDLRDTLKTQDKGDSK